MTETTEDMLARVQASFDRQAFADGDRRAFAVMQATMTAVFGRPGISG